MYVTQQPLHYCQVASRTIDQRSVHYNISRFSYILNIGTQPISNKGENRNLAAGFLHKIFGIRIFLIN